MALESTSGSDQHIFIISGPGGVGKTTLSDNLCEEDASIQKVITATTRRPRAGEVDGKDYIFMSEDEFEQALRRDEFIEHEKVYGRDWYGTPRSEVEKVAHTGAKPLLVIDVGGALKVKSRHPEAVLIFLTPPSLDELRNRLHARGFDGKEAIEDRLRVADYEIETGQNMYDHQIVNDDLHRALTDVKKVIQSY